MYPKWSWTRPSKLEVESEKNKVGLEKMELDKNGVGVGKGAESLLKGAERP